MQLKVELTLSLTMTSIEVIDQELPLEKRLMDTLSSESLWHSNGQSIHLHYSVQQTWGESSDDFGTIAAAAAVSEAASNFAGAVVVVAADAAAGVAVDVAAAAAAVVAAGIAAASAGDGVAASASAFAAAEFAAAAAAGVAAGQWMV